MEIHWKQAVDAPTVMVSQLSWLSPAAEHLWPKKWWPPFWVQKMAQNPRDHLRISSISCNYESYDILWLYLMALSPCISHFRTQTKSRFIVMLWDSAAPRLKRLRSLPNPQVIVRWLRWRSGDNTFWQQKTTPESLISVDIGWYIILNVSHIALISLECNCLLMRPDGNPCFSDTTWTFSPTQLEQISLAA